MAQAARDNNFVPTLLGASSSDGTTPVKIYADPVTHRLLVDIPGTTGTVTSVSVVTANGFAGSVADPTTTPAITLSTTLGSGNLALSNGTGFVAAPLTGTGNVVLATSPTFSGATITTSTVNGVTLTTGGGTTTFLNANGAYSTPAGSSGDVVGPASATDNAIARFDTTTGKLIQNSAATIADTSGNITAGTYNGNTIGAGSTSGTNTGDQTTVSGNAGTATALQNARTIGTLTGDGTTAGSSFNGTANNTNALVLATVNSNVGSFGSATQTGTFTVNGKGLTTAASNVTITPAVGSITGLGTGVATALAVNVGSAGAFVTFNGALGTPSSGTLTNCTGLPAASIVPGTLATGAYILAENASIQLDPAGSADGKYTGITVTATSDYSQAFGDLVYLKASNSRWAAADADAATTAGPVALAMVVVAGTSGNACTLLLQGIIRADAKFPTMTVGATQYVGEAAGEIQGAIPTGADNVIRTVGYALTADELYFNPSTDWQVSVA